MVEGAQYPPGSELPGTVYRVVRHLATGGMGSVYDVEDTTVGKRYVLKTLHPQLVTRQDLARRMKDEARTLAKLQHPNIVDVVTAGVTTDPLRMPFYVMERLNGQNLRVIIEKKGSLELPHCYRIAIDVLDALEHAHENGVIHRDVKPENIFLHRNLNGTTTTKLLDFGIMRLLDRKLSHTHGKFIGTLKYASPEQIMGGKLGPATDIYSLGVVLYEMICGRGPFDDAGDAYAVGAAHAQKPPPPPSTFVRVPEALERLVLAALAKAPEQRPRDCFTFAGELRRMLRGEETAPKSATAVNVLTSAPGTRAAPLPAAGTRADPYMGTELSPPPAPPQSPATAPEPRGSVMSPASAAPPASAASTQHGMPPPSTMGSTLPIGGASAAAAAALVQTLASPGLAASAAPAGEGAPLAPPQGPPPVDRNAETHASSPFGSTRRLAQNGTMMDDGPPPLLPDEAVRAALGEHAPLEVPPAVPGVASGSGSGELNFPPMNVHTGSTGPLAGEASTRPSERAVFLPVLAAAAVGLALVGAAALYVTKPWASPPEAAAAPVAETAAAESAPAASAIPVTSAPVPVVTPAASAAAASAPAPSKRATAAEHARRHAPKAAPKAEPTPKAEAAPEPTATAAPKPAATTPRKAAKPPSGAPRPEDVGFD